MNGREVALITGASMGIGKELAKVFATEGHDLVLVARSEDKLRSLGQELERTHGITAHVVRADLTDPSAPASIFASLESMGLQLDYLVNNAGFSTLAVTLELIRGGWFHCENRARHKGENRGHYETSYRRVGFHPHSPGQYSTTNRG